MSGYNFKSTRWTKADLEALRPSLVQNLERFQRLENEVQTLTYQKLLKDLDEALPLKKH